jgi:hypothetical protein
LPIVVETLAQCGGDLALKLVKKESLIRPDLHEHDVIEASFDELADGF